MADKRTGRTPRERAGRAGRGRTGSLPGGRGAAPEPGGPAPDVERAITMLEDLVLAGRAEEIPRLTAILWNNRAETRQALLRRLQNGSVRVPALLLEVLAGLSGGRASGALRRVAADAEVPDLVRLEARRRSGWPARSEGRTRAAFLQTLHDPSGALQNLVAMGCGDPVPDGEAFEEALGYILALPAAERLHWVQRLAGAYGQGVAWLLRALLAAGDRGTRAAAAEELLRLRDRGSAAALDRLARCRATGGERAGLRVAARRLGLRSVAGAAGPAPRRHRGVVPGGIPAFHEALLTAVDGRGSQAVTIIRAWNPEVRLVVQVLLRDHEGVTAVQGSMRVPREHTAELLRLSGLPDAPLVRVALPEARSVILWAVERRLTQRHIPPAAFALWEPYLFEDLCPAPPADLPPSVLALAPEGVPEAPPADRVGELLSSAFCESWQFGVRELAPVLRALSYEGLGGLDRYSALLRQLCRPAARAMLHERLRRQAWVLERSGRPDLRDTALACASQLASASPEQLSGLPLLRGMLARGLAGLRPPRAGG